MTTVKYKGFEYEETGEKVDIDENLSYSDSLDERLIFLDSNRPYSVFIMNELAEGEEYRMTDTDILKHLALEDHPSIEKILKQMFVNCNHLLERSGQIGTELRTIYTDLRERRQNTEELLRRLVDLLN